MLTDFSCLPILSYWHVQPTGTGAVKAGTTLVKIHMEIPSICFDALTWNPAIGETHLTRLAHSNCIHSVQIGFPSVQDWSLDPLSLWTPSQTPCIITFLQFHLHKFIKSNWAKILLICLCSIVKRGSCRIQEAQIWFLIPLMEILTKLKKVGRLTWDCLQTRCIYGNYKSHHHYRLSFKT